MSKISKIKLGIFYYDYHGRQIKSNWSVLTIEDAIGDVGSYYSGFYLGEGREHSMFYTSQPKGNYIVLTTCRV